MSKLTPPEKYLEWVKNQVQNKYGKDTEPKKVFVNPEYYEDNGFPGDANKDFHIWDFQEAFDRLFESSEYELNKDLPTEFKYVEPEYDPICSKNHGGLMYDEIQEQYYCPICERVQ